MDTNTGRSRFFVSMIWAGVAACLIGLALISGCTRKVSVVPVSVKPKKKFILLHLSDLSKVGAPVWVKGRKYYPLTHIPGFVQFGRASWYGPGFHGKKTSGGELYNMHDMTAAHKTLALGTYVQVINLANGKKAVVRINDRGPFVKGRIIDLSYGAAAKVGLLGPGVARVKLVVLGVEVGTWDSPTGPSPIVQVPNIHQGAFTVQIGAFSKRENALHIADRLKPLFHYVEVIEVKGGAGQGETLFRVRVSRAKTLKAANMIKDRLKRIGFEEAFVVSL